MNTKTSRNPLARAAGFLTALLIGLSAVPLQSLTAFAGEHSAASLQVGEAIYIGDTIDFGTGAYIVYDDEDPEEKRKQFTGVLTLGYDAYYDSYDQFLFKLDSDSSSDQLWITAGAAGGGEPDTPTCITLKSGAGTQSDPYLFDAMYNAPAKSLAAGETYKVGDYIDFGTGNYCMYDDTYSSPSALSGTFMVSSWEYSETYAQYHFVLTGNGSGAVWISSGDKGAPTGFTVTGGSGTASNPYTFGLVFEQPAKPVRAGEIYRDGDIIDFGSGGECFRPDDQEVMTGDEGWDYYYGQWSVSYVKYVPGTGQYEFLLHRDPELYSSNYSKTIRITSEDLGTPTGFRIIDGEGCGDCPYELGVVFAKPLAAGETYRDGDVIDFGNGVYCKLDDQSSTVHQVSDVLKVRFDNYEEDYGQYWYALTDFEADCHDVCITSDDIGMPEGFQVTGGSGTGSDPYTFGLVPNSPIQVGDVFFNGDTIDFGAGAYYCDESGIEVLLSGKWKLVYNGYHPCDDLGDDNSADYSYTLQSGDREESLYLWNERSADSTGITVTSGDGSEEHPYWFRVMFTKPVRVGKIYKVGDTIDFGTGNYGMYDDTYSSPSALSGTYMVSSWEYSETYAQYRFVLYGKNGNYNVDIWITSGDFGTPVGFTVTGGSGTQSDPYTFGVAFAKHVWEDSIFQVGDYIDFQDGYFIVLDEIGDDEGNVISEELYGLRQLRYVSYDEYLGRYVFQLVNESGEGVDVLVFSDDRGTPSGIAITGGSGYYGDPYAFTVMSPVRSVEAGGVYRVGDAVSFGDGVFCELNDQSIPTKLAGIRFVRFDAYSSGLCEFGLPGGEDTRYLYLTSDSSVTPVGFRITGGSGTQSDPYTFSPVFPISATISKTEFAYTGSAVKVGNYLTVKCGDTPLTYGTDFTTSYANNKNVGYQTASVTINGKGEYAGSVTLYYSITPKKQAKPVLSMNGTALHVEWTADASAQGYEVQYCKNSSFTGSTLHTVTYTGKTACNLSQYPKLGETWYVRVRSFISDGYGNTAGFWSDTASMTLASAITSVTLSKTQFAYTGSAVKVGSYLTVKCGDTKLTYGTDYTTSYTANTAVGYQTATVTVKGTGKYSGTFTKKYTIYPKKQAAPVLSMDGTALHVEWTADASALGYELEYCQNSSFSTTDASYHSVTYTGKNAVNLSKYPKVGETWYVRVRAFITNNGKTSGTKYGAWSDAASKKLEAAITNVTLSKTEFVYTGSAVKVGSYLTVKFGDKKLTYGMDYTTTYANNKNVGFETAAVMIKGTGEYTGSVTLHYSILPPKQAKPTLSMDGTALHVAWTVDASAVGYELEYCQNSSFSPTDESYHCVTYTGKTAVNLSKYPKLGETWYVRVRAFITNNGSTSGTKYGEWSDAASRKLTAAITSVTLSKTEFNYTGSAITVGSYLTVKYGDTKLTYGTDYTTSYTANKNCGVKTAKVTVKGTGKYTGTFNKTFTIVPAKQAKPTLTAVSGGFKAEWTADSNAIGYELVYCKDSSFTGDSLHSCVYTATSATLKKYPATGEKWYVKVRAVISSDGTTSGTLYGTYSAVASVTAG